MYAKLRDLACGAAAIKRRFRTISFSQYGEDVLLYNLCPAQHGIYVDVGAYHPQRHSNTYKLYLRGWHGLTIEPNPDAAAQFRKVRPRDTHTVYGVSEQPGKLDYYKFRNPLFNSFVPSYADQVGEAVTEVIPIQCLPLQNIIDTMLPPESPIDLLSIDCESLDLVVLKSLDWDRTRPTGIIIEDADQLCGEVDCYGDSETRAFLRAHGYALFGQSMFSFLYVDLSAINRRGSGFQTKGSQLIDCLVTQEKV